MKSVIRLSLCYVGILAAIFSAYFTAKVFEKSMVEQLQFSLKQDAALIESAYLKLDSVNQLKNFSSEYLRVTLIKSDGSVLYESDSKDSIGNHLSRPEVKAALKNGFGESMRYSVTLNVNVFYFAKKMPDGNILRLGMRQKRLQHYIYGTTPYLLGIIAVIIIISILIAIVLSRWFVRPIQKLAKKINDIDALDSECAYAEIAPFVKEIRNKNRELELTVEKLNDEKQKIDRLKDEFTANAAHELKTPLTTISGYAEMIKSGMVKPCDVSNFAEKIYRDASRMRCIVDDIMTLSKLDKSGKSEVALDANVDLLEEAKECSESLSINANKKNINLKCSGENCIVQGNERLIFEMIYNLVDNAIRYTDNGGCVNINVSASCIAVSDNGMGIPDEYKERIFERFFRVDKSRSRETGGTGLGLAIVKHIAQLHSAKIILESKLGHGTCIKVEF